MIPPDRKVDAKLERGIPEAANLRVRPGQPALRPAIHARPDSRQASTPPKQHLSQDPACQG